MHNISVLPPVDPIVGSESRLKIVQMGPTGPIGGVSAVVIQLSAELARRGHQVLVIGDGRARMQPALEAGAQYEEIIYTRNLAALLRQVRLVRRLLRDYQPDVVHVHGRAQALLVRLSGHQVDWFTLHNTQLTDHVAWYDYGLVRRALSPLGRGIFALDSRATAYLQKTFGVDPGRIRVVSNGIDASHFSPATTDERRAIRSSMGVGDEDQLVAFVGRFHEQKNPGAVIELAAAATRRDQKNPRFLLMGEGPLENSLRQRVRQLGIEEVVRFAAWGDPRSVYQAADLFVLPSHYEGYGLAPAEALACGTPVLRTRTGGFEQMVVEGETGWGCDTEDFVKTALDVLSQPSRLLQMRDRCRRHAVENLSLGAQAQQTVASYRDTKVEGTRRRKSVSSSRVA